MRYCKTEKFHAQEISVNFGIFCRFAKILCPEYVELHELFSCFSVFDQNIRGNEVPQTCHSENPRKVEGLVPD